MQESGPKFVDYDPEPERTLRQRLKAKRQRQAMGEPNPPPRRTLGDYCKRSDAEQISL
ncbi:hypothetical protein A2U01_0062757 [Trifolium medium]|uniref:Uncharacterized protein n=1 Tax=Trifolium medium TaxID=97028 RepID=A0A392RZL5_9FABA|nr:hypothetical protein [Trifolium medium]